MDVVFGHHNLLSHFSDYIRGNNGRIEKEKSESRIKVQRGLRQISNRKVCAVLQHHNDGRALPSRPSRPLYLDTYIGQYSYSKRMPTEPIIISPYRLLEIITAIAAITNPTGPGGSCPMLDNFYTNLALLGRWELTAHSSGLHENTMSNMHNMYENRNPCVNETLTQ
jgi:hypothetical protein